MEYFIANAQIHGHTVVECECGCEFKFGGEGGVVWVIEI